MAGFLAPLLGLGKAVLGSKLGSAAVGLAKTAGSAMLGQAINRRGTQNNMSDKWNFMEGKGLTNTEIAGSGFGSASSGEGSVLGNQANEMARLEKQQAYDAAQRQLDRDVAVRAQDTSAANTQLQTQAQIYSANTSAATARNSLGLGRDRLALDRDTYDNVTLPDALRRSVTEAPAWKRQQLLASMGVDNVIGSAVAGLYGIDVMDPRSLSTMSPADFLKLTRTIYGMQSNAFGEGSGASMLINEAARGFGSVLGSQGGGSVVRR